MNTFIVIAFCFVVVLLLAILFMVDEVDDRLQRVEDDVGDLNPENYPDHRSHKHFNTIADVESEENYDARRGR